jgi:hypothetical protein
VTSEICLLNRYAAVLAADSATTVSQWDPQSGKKVERYFKGSNKIFQLSVRHPVGLMIYATSTLNGLPWEIITKEFRAHLKDTPHQSVEEYGQAFFDFIRANRAIWPQAHLDEQALDYAVLPAAGIVWAAEADQAVKNAATDAAKIVEVRRVFDEKRVALAGQALPPVFDAVGVGAAKVAHSAELSAKIEEFLKVVKLPNDLTPGELADFALDAVFKTYTDVLSDELTGIVVAGFGEKEFFPSYKEFHCYGFLFDRLIVTNGDSRTISHQVSADIKGFAQTSMVDTFELGVSYDVFASARRHAVTAFRDLADRISNEVGIAAIPNLEKHTNEVLKDHTAKWMQDARNTHRSPLHRVIGSLPINEMAQLAESLISLQSLKEKVTKPSESVGGPIDVAVITRAEGLVWVKRKYYFDPDINPRFFQRQRRIYEG